MKFPLSFVSLLSLVLAVPAIVDVHDTQAALIPLDGTSSSLDPSHFAVQVVRIDDLVDTDAKKELAVKTTAVLLKFDVDSDGLVTVNDRPVPMGISDLQIEAKTTVGLSDGVDTTLVVDNMDVGIVDVQLNVKGFAVNHNGIQFRRLVITENIIQVNKEEVQQQVLVQQVLQILPDGSVQRMAPCHVNSLDAESPISQDLLMAHHHHGYHYKGIDWITYIVLAAGVGSALYFLVSWVVALFTPSQYLAVPVSEKEQVVVDKKLEVAAESLPVYDPEYKA
ncbi:hypothetical protein BC833DRAFT_561427 [Globomyces pollinis-pini]|nr:hypothetical protein BC833DRAFT_561427 [Globomyces pollinis-pini]KAJ2998314.1 hypothetical protein HDV02_004628 [Globomyces sp. JEL0801]